jgi:small subunit ribosomal protein S21
VSVKLRRGESQERLLRRFRRAVQRARILSEVRRRRHFISKGEERRFRHKRALRRIRRRERRTRENRYRY